MLGAARSEEQGAEAISSVAEEMYAIAAAHGFHEEHVRGQVPPDFGNFCMNLVAEVAELWEAYREGRLDRQCEKKCKLSCSEEELADIVIRAMDTAEQLGVNLGRAVARKAAYNRTRPYRHGGKRA
jgi:NTP pyrophosphatase (non-canonical NTP hydrolase)